MHTSFTSLIRKLEEWTPQEGAYSSLQRICEFMRNKHDMIWYHTIDMEVHESLKRDSSTPRIDCVVGSEWVPYLAASYPFVSDDTFILESYLYILSYNTILIKA